MKAFPVSALLEQHVSKLMRNARSFRLLPILVLSLWMTQVNGQSSIQFSTMDTVFVSKANSDEMIGTTFLSTPNSQLIGEWEIILDSIPSDWEIVSLCDNVLCYFAPIPEVSFLDTILKNDPSDIHKFELTLHTPSNGKAIFSFRFKDTKLNDSANLTFVFDRQDLNQVKTISESKYVVYPNPVESQLHIQTDQPESGRFALTDGLGQLIDQGYLSASPLDVSHL